MVDFLVTEFLDVFILWTIFISIFLFVVKKVNGDLIHSIYFLNTIYYSFILIAVILYGLSLSDTSIGLFNYDLIRSTEIPVFANVTYQDSYIDLFKLVTMLYGFFVFVQIFIFLKHVGMIAYIRRSANLDNELTNTVQAICDMLNIKKKINVYLSHRTISPYSFGVFKPSIVFPTDLKTTLREKDIELILKHEVIHIKNNDFLGNIIQTLVKIAFSFNPLMWWLDKEISVSREVRCDQMVLKTETQRKPYSALLLYLATEWQKQLPETAVIAFYKPSHQLNRRIHMIKLKSNVSKLKRNSRIASFLVLSVTVVLACSSNTENNLLNEKIVNSVLEVEPLIQKKNKTYEFFQVTQKPEIKYKEPVKYPSFAQKTGIEGMVVTSITINTKGEAEDIKIVKGHAQLNDAAIESLKKWRFAPAYKGNKAVKVRWEIPFKFVLNKNKEHEAKL